MLHLCKQQSCYIAVTMGAADTTDSHEAAARVAGLRTCRPTWCLREARAVLAHLRADLQASSDLGVTQHPRRVLVGCPATERSHAPYGSINHTNYSHWLSRRCITRPGSLNGTGNESASHILWTSQGEEPYWPQSQARDATGRGNTPSTVTGRHR